MTGCNTATALSRARAYADGSLAVRNRFGTRRLQRAGIDRVVAGRQGGLGSAHRVELLLTDGTVLHRVATETPPFAGRHRVRQQAGELRGWLGGV